MRFNHHTILILLAKFNFASQAKLKNTFYVKSDGRHASNVGERVCNGNNADRFGLHNCKNRLLNPKPVTVEGVFTGYVDAGRMWSHHIVLQDDTGFLPTQYHQFMGVEYLMGMFKSGRALGRPVRVEGCYRRFGSPYLEISTYQFLDTRKTHRSWYPAFRLFLFLLCFGLGMLLLAAGHR